MYDELFGGTPEAEEAIARLVQRYNPAKKPNPRDRGE